VSTWETTELPVLRAVRAITEQRGQISVARISRETGLRSDDVRASLRRLAEARPPYITGTNILVGDGVVGGRPSITGLTPRAEDALARDDAPL
jgi:hypothetical protein